jgi:hypothetical protein
VSTAARLSSLPLAMRRAIALGLLLLAALLAWLMLVVPLRGLLLSQQEWRAVTAREIARDRGLAQSAAQLHEISTAVNASPLLARLYEPSSGTAVTDQLQSELRDALVQSGVVPTTFKVLPGDLVGGLRAHRVEFASVMSVEQLRAFFLALAAQPHYVRVERLQLSAPQQQRSDENPPVNVLIEARGFALDLPATSASLTRVTRAY